MRAPSSLPARATQRGAVLMVMLVILVMGALTYLVNSLSTSAQKTARQEKTAEALAQAKEALIGRAVADDNHPGSLPCPDLITNTTSPILNIPNDGVADSLSGNECPSYIGWLPWKTLGLPDLRDGTGERLWYVLSRNFRDDNSNPINSDSSGALIVDGNITISNIAAIVVAPGAPLCGKSHNSNNVTDYLEAGDGTATTYNLKSFSDECNNFPYNDNLLAITASQILPVTEKVVGKRVRDLLNASHAILGRFPFATPFSDPSASTFIATIGTYEGLLPGATATWSAIPVFSLSGGSADVWCELKTGNNSLANARARCNISNIIGTPTITMTGILNYRGLWSEYDLANSAEVRAKIRGTSCATPNPASGSTVNCAATAVPGLNASINYSVNADRSVTVTFTGTLFDGVAQIYLRDMVLDGRYDWITQNQWNRVMYYAASSGHAPNGANSCNPLPGAPPSCLKQNNSDNNQAVIIMTGSALTGQTHPQSSIAHYLEGENATPADFIYENKARTNTFNDQVIVVAP